MKSITRHEQLCFFDRLEVGPIKLEADRVSTEYRVTRGDGSDSIDLIFSFEEDVFDPADPHSQNLAAMMTAQVALNYSLFCREMEFHGLFDAADRRFLRTYAENTAREVLVMKLLQDNPYIRHVDLKPRPRKHYGNAKLVFPSMRGSRDFPWKAWENDRLRHAVLSSGGKDSLLSYGLLGELGYEPHAIFVNESGRHWFTALNAYRALKSNPSTHRVWCNSDRVFNWMLRQMPIVRHDFAKIRADIYAIRMWTVAVFLFGALPLMRKHGLARLVIGDEYDTSEPQDFHGIKHFGGLFDQSRFFDHELSAYFMAKGWGVRQFSILRPCSELLIETILSKRYPDLLKEQVSCHAAHKQGERIAPCGKCEKCRRIVAMLHAIGVDSGLCGYSPEMQRACLDKLLKKKIKQEEEGASHLAHLLVTRGVFDESDVPEAARRPYPEVMMLRFHRQRSPWTDIPLDLRRPLYRIMLEQANGALYWTGKRWVELVPEQHKHFNDPYAFEQDAALAQTGARSHVWGELTWVEAEQRLKEIDLAILPVGAVEQHGPHLPLDIDAFDARHLAFQVAEACSDPKPLVLPSIDYGVSYHHDDFAGTISISQEALVQMVVDIGTSLARNGIRKMVIINGHGGNEPALHYAAQKINSQSRLFVCVDTGETSDVDVMKWVETENDVHAGEYETSTALATRPHLVRRDMIKAHEPNFTSRYLAFTSGRGVTWFANTKKLSKSGVMGDPSKASTEKGRRIWEITVAHLVALVEELKELSLDEIYQRRY